MSLKSLTFLLLAATAVAIAPVNSGAEEAAAAVAPVAPSIRVVPAQMRELVEALSVTGTIVAREEAAAGTDLGGLTVTSLNTDEGDIVKTGDVLAVLDRSGLDTQLAQIDASRAQAEANIAQMRAQIGDAEVAVRQAQEGLARAQALRDKGVAAQSQLDQAVNAADSAAARLNSAKMAVEASEAQLAVIDAQKKNLLLQIAKTEVKAPADGLILSRNATLGGIVSGQGGPLFRIAIMGEFELAADVSETALPRLAAGMHASVALAGVSEPLPGTVRRISPEIDQKTRLGSIRIALGPDAKARVGNFARGEIELARREGVSVPASALVYKGSDAFLQRVQDGRVRTVPVALGARDGALVEIVRGLEAGAEVVARAGTFVADGDAVTPVRSELTGAIKP